MVVVALLNIGNIRAPKAPNLPVSPTVFSQDYFNMLTNILRLYFNQIDKVFQYVVNPDIGYYLNTPYGAFSDSTTQSAAVINTAYAITYNTTTLSDSPAATGGQPDIYIDPAHTSHVVILFPAIYNFQFSLQLTKSSVGAAYIYIWARVNGVDIPDSATKLSLQGVHDETVAAWNFVLATTLSGDYFELMWATDDTHVNILAEAATAFCPAIPSVILTVSGISA
jgi:hypothetical protein